MIGLAVGVLLMALSASVWFAVVCFVLMWLCDL